MNKGLLDRDNPAWGLYPEETEVTGRVCGALAQVEIKQVYRNNDTKAIDTVYVFPVPPSATVTDFHASTGKAKINGFIMEREEALLADEGRRWMPGDGVALGMLPPGEKLCIHITYVQQLEYYDGQLRFIIPALVGPGCPGLSAVEQAHPKERPRCKTRLNICMDLHRRVLSFRSPSHAIKVDMPEEHKAMIGLRDESEELDRDFVLSWACREEESSRGTAYSTGNGRGTLYLTFVPELPSTKEAGAKDYVFLLDTSEAMTGEKLAQAKSGLRILLRNLSEIDTFRIVAFGNKLLPFAGGNSLPYAQASLDRASAWTSGLMPGGKADIYKALRYALPPGNCSKSTILLLTAGRIEHSDDPINYVKNNIGKNKVHVLGTDTGANLCMLKRISGAGGGDCRLLNRDERIEDSMLRLFAGISAPVAEKTLLDWTGIATEDVFVDNLTNVCDLQPVTVLACFSGPLEGKALLRGNTDGGIFHLTLDASDIELGNRWGFIEKLWAKNKIEHLEGILAYTSPEKYEDVRNEIIKLSKNHNIPSSFTNLVAVKVIPDRLTGRPVPRMLTAYQHNEKAYHNGEPANTYAADIGHQNTGNTAPTLAYCDILRILAANQRANGAFYAGDGDSLLARLDTTALALIAFTAGKESIGVYRKQLEKSAGYLTERITNGRITPEWPENTQTLLRSILALKLCLAGNVLKQTDEEWVTRWIEEMKVAFKASLAITGGGSELLDLLNGESQWQSSHTIGSITAVNDAPSVLRERIALSANEGDAVPTLARLGVLEALKE